MATELDPESVGRLGRLAEVRRTSPEMLLREAAEQFLAREEAQEQASDRHPSGRPWPSWNPVGGIITPV
jgi:predicted transcriptional regulator